MNSVLALDAVIFDLDDTLHDDSLSFRNAAAHVAETCFDDLQVGKLAAAAYVTELERFWGALSSSAVKQSVTGMRERVWSAALKAIGETAQSGAVCAQAYDQYRREHFILWGGVRELLIDLRKHGSRLALLTNGFTETHREKIELLGLRDLFDVCIISDEVGMVKPDPEIFRLVCDRLGVQSVQATMVGDRLDKDISGAQAFGMKTLWLNIRNEEPKNELAIPDVTVTSFRGVDEVLRATMQAESTATGVIAR